MIRLHGVRKSSCTVPALHSVAVTRSYAHPGSLGGHAGPPEHDGAVELLLKAAEHHPQVEPRFLVLYAVTVSRTTPARGGTASRAGLIVNENFDGSGVWSLPAEAPVVNATVVATSATE